MQIEAEHGQYQRPRTQDYGLKVCNACGTLNHIGNTCCINCSWEGNFDLDPERIFGILVDIQQYVCSIVDRELDMSLPWRKTLSVHIKSVIFTVNSPDHTALN